MDVCKGHEPAASELYTCQCHRRRQGGEAGRVERLKPGLSYGRPAPDGMGHVEAVAQRIPGHPCLIAASPTTSRIKLNFSITTTRRNDLKKIPKYKALHTTALSFLISEAMFSELQL